MKKNLSNQKREKKVTQAPLQNIIYWQLFILFATLVAYFPSFLSDFVNWDDDIYIFTNPYIKSLSANNIGNIFSSFFNGNYHPLTMLSYAIENSIAGETPFIYHFTNILFHLANTYLVFVFVQKLFTLILKDDKKGGELLIAAVSSLLFGLHPLHVESVSWVSERKDVLYTFFFLLGLISYVRYIQTPKLKTYSLALFFFILSVLSKGMAVSFAVSIIAIDYVLKRNLLSKKIILEKIPFLLLSVIFGIIAIQAQKDLDAIITEDVYTFSEKLAFSSYGLAQYFTKIFVPFNLCHYYPYPDKINGAYPQIYYVFPFIILSGLAALLIFFRKSRIVIFGFLFFLTNIFLVLKFIPVGGVIMADRYTYLASIGIFILIALLFEYVINKKKLSKGKIVFILAIYVLFLGIQTHQRTKVWKDSYSLWNDANNKFPQNPTILLNKAISHLLNGEVELAMKDFRTSAKLDPQNYKAYTNMGNIELSKGNYEQSIALYSKSLAINDNREKAYCSRGQALINIGRVDEALADLNKAIKLNPIYTEAYQYRGTAKYMKRDYNGALKDYNILIDQNPNYAEAYFGRALCLLNTNSKGEACKNLHRAAQLNYKPALDLFNNICR